MTTHEKVFFSILRSSLWGTSVEIPDGFTDWDKVIKLAKDQALLGLVGNVLLKNPTSCNALSEDFCKRIREFIFVNASAYFKLNNSLTSIVNELNNSGIDSVLLKGQGLARNYPNPELRQCGDIDLYVGVKNYHKSYEILKPFTTEIDEESALDKEEKHYHAKIFSTILEVHKYAEVHPSSTYNDIYQKYANDGLSNNLVKLDFDGISINTPSNNFNAFYVFNHMWHHYIARGVGLRQVCDWTMFLHSRAGKLDFTYLSQLLSEMKLMGPWQTFGCIVVNFLGLPKEEFPFYNSNFNNKSQNVLNRILNEGNFGRQTAYVRKHTRGYLYEKLFSLRCHIVRFMGMFMTFPRHSMIQIYHSITRGTLRVFADFKKKRNST